MPPDGLKDRYAWAGKSIVDSPHYRLMRDLDTGSLAMSSEYVQLCLTGTLDARRPFGPKLQRLRRIFTERMDELSHGQPIDIFVYQPAGTDKLIIVDGKHRAALAAYFEVAHTIRLNFISSDPFRHPFFLGFYEQVLSASSQDYSINQNLIRLMLESERHPKDFIESR
jgi:hypothetical protein